MRATQQGMGDRPETGTVAAAGPVRSDDDDGGLTCRLDQGTRRGAANRSALDLDAGAFLP